MCLVGGKSDPVNAEGHDEHLVRFRAAPDPQPRVCPRHLRRAQLPRPIRGRIQDDEVAGVDVGQVDHLSSKLFSLLEHISLKG